MFQEAEDKEIEVVVTERAYIDSNNYLHLVYTNGQDVNLGKVVGEDGTDGAPGLKGADGEQGLQGIPGVPGEQGPQGIQGPIGFKGDKGEPGERGEKGIAGIPGLNGSKGDKGEPGLDGKDGLDGANGADGKDGKDGKDGLDGKDTPTSKWLSVIDIDFTTNQENPNKEIAIIPVEKITSVDIKILGYGAGGLNWFTAQRAATFVNLAQGIEKIQEDVIKEPARTSSSDLKVTLTATTKGCSIVVFGSPNEEVTWKGTICIGAI
jgi:hypothetical protein